jgi:hypothetical protein
VEENELISPTGSGVSVVGKRWRGFISRAAVLMDSIVPHMPCPKGLMIPIDEIKTRVPFNYFSPTGNDGHNPPKPQRMQRP